MAAVKERPILWSAPMVLALLAGRKTQTRRIVKPRPPFPVVGGWKVEDYTGMPFACVGDRLWGRETFYCCDYRYPNGPRADLLKAIEYRATHDCRNWEAGCPCRDDEGRGSWRPSIFMPRWASRLLHEVTAVRVERLQDISAADAIAEGIEEVAGLGVPEFRWPGGAPTFLDPRDCYLAGWDSINGNGSAAKNPLVWVVSFKAVAQ